MENMILKMFTLFFSLFISVAVIDTLVRNLINHINIWPYRDMFFTASCCAFWVAFYYYSKKGAKKWTIPGTIS